MPFSASFLRHTHLWTLPGGEVASSSCHWRATGESILEISDGLAAAFSIKGVDLWDDIKNKYAGGVFYNGGRLALISVNGTTVETVELSVTPSSGGDAVPCLPTEVAVVASLKTATYSRSGRGRMYLPPPSRGNLEDSGRLLAATRGQIATAMGVYLDPVTVDSQEYVSVVASFTQNQLRPINQVKVGDVFDAQRRRRDALIEVYSTATVA